MLHVIVLLVPDMYGY